MVWPPCCWGWSADVADHNAKGDTVMMPRFMVTVAGAAIVVAAMAGAGCSSKNSSTGSSNTAPIYTSTTAPFYTGPKRTVAQTPTCQPPATYGPIPGLPNTSECQNPRPAPPAPEAGAVAAQYKIIINGQDITPTPSQFPGKVQCTKGTTGTTGSTDWTIETTGSTSSATATVSDTDPPQVTGVTVNGPGSVNGIGRSQWTWGGSLRVPVPGNAEVSKSGKTYTFTGNLSPFFVTGTTGSPVPFEFDATCP